MTVADYIVDFLIKRGVHHVFGYPGGMVTYLLDAFYKRQDEIEDHVLYHEQGAALAACGYAQSTGCLGVAYATSGPGATNLITGIANAYFDSIPCLFITGQVHTEELRKNSSIRQNGFQETDIVSIVLPVTKYAAQITDAQSVPKELEKAFHEAFHDRKGPVLLDIPIDIFRCDVKLPYDVSFDKIEPKFDTNLAIDSMVSALKTAHRPLIIAGNGIQTSKTATIFKELFNLYQIPVVTSMPAVGLLEFDNPLCLGFLGAYGHRCANFAVQTADVLLVLGSRLSVRQTGGSRTPFAPEATILRVDIDTAEIDVKLPNERVFYANLEDVLPGLLRELSSERDTEKAVMLAQREWTSHCAAMKAQLREIDDTIETAFVKKISMLLPDSSIITTDVGQNQVWMAQAFACKKHQQMLFSGGHGTMGYALPAAIGASIGTEMPVFCFCGDGGLQMNIQELQTIARDKLNIKIFVLNNHSLGMIRHFQELYFESRFVNTTERLGYTIPQFEHIAKAYGIAALSITHLNELETLSDLLESSEPCLINVQLSDCTYVFPKLSFGRPIYDQDPLLDRDVVEKFLGFAKNGKEHV